jgi:hypothetical protein
MSYIDLFHLLGTLFLFVTPLVWIMRRPRQGARRAAGPGRVPAEGPRGKAAVAGASAGAK